jgi:1-deoxy-D-xylulose-5-phosphate synthase
VVSLSAAPSGTVPSGWPFSISCMVALRVATLRMITTEKDPITFHAVPKFDPTSGCLPKSSGGMPSYSKIFGDWLCETAAKDSKLMAVTPAMREGSGMVEFSKKYPDQYFDVAIAEQHAVTFAAGLAIGGYKPIVAIYSTFLQRAYDQVIHDVAIQKLPVLFAIDRAGIVGADGQTHQGAFDISYLRCIPDMVIMTPSDENECRQMRNLSGRAQYLLRRDGLPGGETA